MPLFPAPQCCCGSPTPCVSAVQAKWRGVEAVGGSAFSTKWIVWKCTLAIHGALGSTAVLLVWDGESGGQATYVRARSTDPDLEVSATFDAIPRDDWNYGNPGPGSGPGCSVDDCEMRYAWWLLNSLTVSYNGETYVFLRSEDGEDEHGEMVAQGDYCLSFSGEPVVTRRIIAAADYAEYTMNYAVAGLHPAADIYACNPFFSWPACDLIACCGNGSLALQVDTAAASMAAYDGFHLGAVFLPQQDADCGCCDTSAQCLHTIATCVVGATPHGVCGGSMATAGGTRVECDGDDHPCMHEADIVVFTHVIACNDKHPLYDPITADEWVDTTEPSSIDCCHRDDATVTIEEAA